MTFFIFLLLFILGQRLFEIHLAKKNERWMKEKGAIEVASDHYKWFIWLHTLFFISLILEVSLQSVQHNLTVNWFFLWIFILMQIGRAWCILSLGKFWNTKIIVLPNVVLLKKGPYRWLKHPNYIIVLIELFVIPIMFHAYISSVLFPTLHILLLTIRIPAEEEALGDNLYYNNREGGNHE